MTNLPTTEKELRILATQSMLAFLQELPVEALEPDLETVPLYSLRDIKAATIWAARQSIRQFCPHLKDTGLIEMTGQFTDEEDTFI